MIKVCILDHCEFCDGEAYIFDYQDVDTRGETSETAVTYSEFYIYNWIMRGQ